MHRGIVIYDQNKRGSIQGLDKPWQAIRYKPQVNIPCWGSEFLHEITSIEVKVQAFAFPENRSFTADQVCLNNGEVRYRFNEFSLSQRLMVQTLMLPFSSLRSTSRPRQPSQARICSFTVSKISKNCPSVPGNKSMTTIRFIIKLDFPSWSWRSNILQKFVNLTGNRYKDKTIFARFDSNQKSHDHRTNNIKHQRQELEWDCINCRGYRSSRTLRTEQ